MMGKVGTYLTGFIGAIVLFLIVAQVLPTLSEAGNEINETGLPLSGLFASDGLIFIVILAGLLLGVIGFFWMKGK